MSHNDFDVITGPAALLRPVPSASLPPAPPQPPSPAPAPEKEKGTAANRR